jgi:hypothetical protein
LTCGSGTTCRGTSHPSSSPRRSADRGLAPLTSTIRASLSRRCLPYRLLSRNRTAARPPMSRRFSSALHQPISMIESSHCHWLIINSQAQCAAKQPSSLCVCYSSIARTTHAYIETRVTPVFCHMQVDGPLPR